MDKEKILAMSREEYEYEDLAEREACEKGAIKTHALLFYICMGLFVLLIYDICRILNCSCSI